MDRFAKVLLLVVVAGGGFSLTPADHQLRQLADAEAARLCAGTIPLNVCAYSYLYDTNSTFCTAGCDSQRRVGTTRNAWKATSSKPCTDVSACGYMPNAEQLCSS